MGKKERTIISEGTCVCTREPRGEGGLEGFDRDLHYKYQEMRDEKGTYHRMYHPADMPGQYYTCGSGIFKQHFGDLKPVVKFCAHKSPPVNPNDQLAMNAISLKHSYWEIGQRVTFWCMEGHESGDRETIFRAMSKISSVCNISFQEVLVPDEADIRIGFIKNDGAWSYPGIHSKSPDIPLSEPTLNLGWVDYETALHELCHAIGMMHEHQHFESDFEWDTDVVYSDMEAMGWSKKSIDHNILSVHKKVEVDASKYDSKSIMHYWFPPRWIKKGKLQSEPNKDLSEGDIKHLKMLYPFNNVVTLEPEETDGQGYIPEDYTAVKSALVMLMSEPKEAARLTENMLASMAFELGIHHDNSKGTKKDLIQLISHKLNT